MSPTRLYSDTSLYVAVLLGPGSPSYQESLETLHAAEDGTFEGVISALVPAEVVGSPAIRAPQGLPRSEAARRMSAAANYFGRHPFRYLEIDRRAGLRAAEIARQFDMKGADALHLAVAEVNGCGLFCSLDHDQLKVGNQIAGLEVRRPELLEQGEFDFSG